MVKRGIEAQVLLATAATLLFLPVAAIGQNIPPVCDAGGPYNVLIGETIQFDGTGSTDPDGVIIRYSWTFGDGATATGPQPTHTYTNGDVYTVSLRVTDNVGGTTGCDVIADVEAEVPDLPRTRTLEDYMSQAATALPPMNPSILDAPTGEAWFSGMTVEQVATSMRDQEPNTVMFDGPLWIGYDDPESTSTRFVKLDFSRDYLRYINQEREFRWEFPHVALNAHEALDIFMSAIDMLGVPGEEMSAPRVDTVVGMDFDPASGRETEQEVERLVTLPRRINGYPVIGSMARMAISNLGDVARALVKWPRFELIPDPELLPREEVVRGIAERIWEAEQGVEVEVDVVLGYSWTPGGFVPVAQVGVTDIEGLLEGGMIELVPLVGSTTGASPQTTPSPLFSLRVRFAAATGRADVQFELPEAQKASLNVYDAAGRKVRTLADGQYTAGRHAVVWDGRDARGQRVASGIYFVRLDAEHGELVQKMMVVR